jgi:hypothetical protein
MSSPTQRSLKKLRAEGYMAEVVEKFNRFAGPFGQRKDLFGWMDILAVRGDEVIGVQSTSGSNASARVNKIVALQSADAWLVSRNRRIVVHGWAKRGPRGKVKRWTCAETEIRSDDLILEHGRGK